MSVSCIVFLGVALTTGCGATADYDDPHVIKDNRGGYIHEAVAERQKLAAWGGQVEIQGVCNSACAIYITLPNACLHPDARIGFHRSSVNFGPIGNAQLSAFFRGGVKQKYDTVWGLLPEGQNHTITAQEFVALDPQSRICR